MGMIAGSVYQGIVVVQSGERAGNVKVVWAGELQYAGMERFMCVCVCVCACVRACVRACVCACVCVCV